MTATTTTTPPSGYLASLLAGQPQLAPSPLGWLNDLRAEAVDRVGVLTVPTVRDEDWRFTDISPLTRLSFQPLRTATPPAAIDLAGFAIEEAATRLVFVDGVYAPAQSSVAAGGVAVSNLAQASVADAAAIEPYLGRLAGFRDDVFTALNTAFLQDGALIVVPGHVALTSPVHLLFVATQPNVASYPRCVVVGGPGSSATVIEEYVAMNDGAYFTNAVTEMVLAPDARIDHVRVQRDSGQAFHIANCAVTLGRGSRLHSVSVALGARISRYNLSVLQTAEGATCVIDGLAVISERQLADTHSSIDHAQPHGVSRQLHKCIVAGAAHAVFNGKIMVRPGAQRTDSAQSSRNLLLSGRAHVDTKPQLEIFADDVKCAHGATVGRLDTDAVFYLRSRGLSDAAARNLLTYAFGAEIIGRIPIASLRQRLQTTLFTATTRQP